MAACSQASRCLSWVALLLLAHLSSLDGQPVNALEPNCPDEGNCSITLLPGAYSLPVDGVTRNLTIVGGDASSTTVQLPGGPSPFVISPGVMLTLINVTVIDILVEYTPANTLVLDGVTLDQGAAVTLQGATIKAQACSDWTALRSAICDDGRVFGDLQSLPHQIIIDKLDDVVDSPIVGWQGVTLLEPTGPACAQPGATPSCVTKSFMQGDSGVDVITVLATANSQTQAHLQAQGSAPAPAPAPVPAGPRPPGGGPGPARPPQQPAQQPSIPRIFILLQSVNSVLAMAGPSSAQLTLYYNTTIKGAPGTSPISELDVRLASSVLRIQGSGTLTFRDLALVNMPTAPAFYPVGLLTCLPWFVSGLPNPSQDSSTRLVMDGVSLVLPADELQYMWQWVNSDTDSARYISEDYMKNTATADQSPDSNATPLVLASVLGRQGVWRWDNVLLYANDNDMFSTPRSMNWSGLPAALQLPQELQAQAPVQLSQITQVPSVLNLTVFNVSGARSIRPPYNSVHYMMRASSTLSDPSAALAANVQLAADMLMVGDPLRPTQFTLDLSSARPDTNGIIGMDTASSATLYLRSMLLLNAQPARPVGAPPRNAAPRPTPAPLPSGRLLRRAVGRSLQQAGSGPRPGSGNPTPADLLYNFTTLLWMFRTTRAEPCSAFAPSALRNCALLNLTNVTIVVPPIELQLLRTLARPGGVATSVNWGLNQDAATMLQHQLNASTIDQRTWGGLDMESNITGLPALPSTDMSAVPGDIMFTLLSWFGMVGSDVTFTSVAPAEAALLQDIVQLLDSGAARAGAGGASVGPGTANRPKPPVAPTFRRPPQVPPAPSRSGPMDNLSADAPAEPNSDVLAGWRLALVIVASVVVAAAVGALLAVWALRTKRSRRGATVVAKPNFPPDLAMGSSAFGPYPQPGLGSNYSNNPLSTGHKGPSPAGSSAMGDGSSGYPGTSLIAPAALASSVRQDTEDLLGEIFRDTDRDATPLGSAVSTAPGSTVTPRAAGLSGTSDVSAAALAALAAASDPRHKIQREISLMRDELHGNRSPWEVQGQLGKGAFGVVYKGTWRGLEVAIKRVIFQVLSADSNEEMTRHTALREAAINATLDHPHIVATYTYDMQPLGGSKGTGSSGGVSDWQMYIVQEYCDGGSLFDAIQQRRFHANATAAVAAALPSDQLDGQAEAAMEMAGAAGAESGQEDKAAAAPGKVVVRHILAIASDIASGCAYIHSKNIIHGDLKPDNVLLKIKSLTGRQSWQDGGNGDAPDVGPGCVAKVADFGMSMNIRGNNTHISGVRHGTPLYIPPEILRNGKASKSADVYSFGVIMWELYHGTSAWQHLIQVTGGPVKKRNLVTFQPDLYGYDMATCELPAYAELGRACLSEDPTARPTFNEVVAALEAMKVGLEAAGGAEMQVSGVQEGELGSAHAGGMEAAAG